MLLVELGLRAPPLLEKAAGIGRAAGFCVVAPFSQINGNCAHVVLDAGLEREVDEARG